MRSAVPFQFTSFFMVGRGESFTTMSRSFNKDSSDGPRVWLGAARRHGSPTAPRQGQPLLPRPRCPSRLRTPTPFGLASALGRRAARLLCFLDFTSANRGRGKLDYLLKIPQAVYDRVGS